MHGVGTVVFTVSAQFGVPVITIWGLSKDITSLARYIELLPVIVVSRFKKPPSFWRVLVLGYGAPIRQPELSPRTRVLLTVALARFP